MKFSSTTIPGIVVIEPQVWRDERGFFIETYNEKPFTANGITATFVQDNLSSSHRGVLRGMHAQAGPNAQGKLVRVLRGRVLDVAVDIRKASKTYGQHFSIILDAQEAKSLWIPPGFLHGFVALEDDTLFAYKVTGFYDKAGEVGVRWDDPDLGIDWPLASDELIISEKDRQLPFLKDIANPF
ncbi:dTDP-4-dehydrorhamnose 3,5-epimerase [Parapedobacter sp. ISTM3]|uniref:dTDP-4-dehydrorhamnose 3,5-epimerase n=1 Tax=Parapedobacter luteus TaxID=623280 RepID=A0A1T5AHM3_9SPHI|nr:MULTISPECIES: dTDP-4-dehydrorhamnose 3,5-epimerase [Parapedobacter]MBK1441811.1 dTDP-4-dehydrorhamnose 3,5-epimerase [Parapedobacter sp. ISTM3]SKB34359.1 dTDP-4-dehydrorhamnose 3,5-epimerase [Parapedobacter luteus]